MKKALVTAALVTSHAQGIITFDNYDSTPYMPVVWSGLNPYPQGTGVADPNVHVDLLYTIGTAEFATTDLGLSVPINPTKVDSFGNHGYWNGVNVTIPGYVSGPVTFQVKAWQTAGPYGGATFALSEDKGISAAWQESSLVTRVGQSR